MLKIARIFGQMTSLELVERDGIKLWQVEYSGMTRFFLESEKEYVFQLMTELEKLYSRAAQTASISAM